MKKTLYIIMTIGITMAVSQFTTSMTEAEIPHGTNAPQARVSKKM